MLFGMKNSIKQISIMIITGTLSLSASANMKAIRDKERRKPAGVLQRELRLAHAQELLGKHYNQSVVRSGEKVRKINQRIYDWTKAHLPKKYVKQHKAIAQAIIDESMKHEFDPVFLMSVIQGESSFDPEMRGKLDEIGLMQIRPATGKEVAEMIGIRWRGEKSLLDPITNIKLGAAYIAHLREQYDFHAQLYLAAYNMGGRNVDRAIDKDVWPKQYPTHVMKYYVDFYSQIDEETSKKQPKG